MLRYLILPALLSLFAAGCTLPAPDAPIAAEQQGDPAAGEESPEPGPEAQVADVESAGAETAIHPAQELIDAFTSPAQAQGDLLVLYGQVLDVAGEAVPGAVVEIWQTDSAGVYDHPGDPGTANRDTSFQFYGSSAADEEGWYAFRTILPGRYEPRPRHIHYKVKQGGNTLLTSQFYFSDDVAEVENERMFQAVGESGDLLLLQLVQGADVLLANGRIVVDTGIGAGDLPMTPSQGEGPYYPVAAVSEYDNDLVALP